MLDRFGQRCSAGDPPALALLSGLWLALLCWLAFFHRLGSLGLMDKTEALFVEVAHQMLQRGDWVTPWWNGQAFFDYPVWGYWMVALSFRLFGVSEWAARLPVALAASAVVVATFLLVWHFASPGEPPRSRWLRGALAAGVLATTPGWIGWGRSSTTDMFLASAITLALYSFLLAHHARPGHRLAWIGELGMALFAGIAVLAKGPVGLLLPLLVVAVFLSLSRSWWRWLRPSRIVAMGALFLAVVLPWYGAAARAHGAAFLGGFLGFSNLQRFTSVLYDHPGPPWFYLPWIVLLLLPWSVFLPAAIAGLRFWQPARWQPDSGQTGGLTLQPGEHIWALPASGGVVLFLLLWLVLVVAFFSAAATKLPGYILPSIPAAALLVALYWRPLQGGQAGGWPLRTGAWLEAGLLALMAVAAAWAPHWAATDPANPGLAPALQSSGLPAVLAVLLAMMALTLVVLLLRHPAADGWLWAPGLLGFLAVLALVITPLAPLLDRQRQLPLRQLAGDARQAAQPAEPLWVVGTKRYSMVFYAGESAAFVAHRRFMASRIEHDPEALLLRPESRSVRLLGDRRDLEALGIPAAAITRLSRRNQQELWRVPVASLPRR